MSIINPNAMNAFKFPEYLDMLKDPKSKELFVGQRLTSKDECVEAIKQYSLKVSADYRVVNSKPTIYVGKYWKLTEGCNWWV